VSDGSGKFFLWAVKIAFVVLAAGHIGDITMALGRLAVHAHLQDQMSYSKFNKELWTAHARPKTRQALGFH
jgi:hypothetical protein